VAYGITGATTLLLTFTKVPPLAVLVGGAAVLLLTGG
jgi:hypothetical protein